MADVKLLMPDEDSGNLKTDFENLKNRFIAVIKELEFLLNNLDEENVLRAASVYAENIDTKNAKITNAQIKSLSADKLTAGTIDAEEIDVINLNADNIVSGTINTENITISSNGESLIIENGLIRLFDSNNVERLVMGLDNREVVNGEVNPYYNKFYFSIADKLGDSSIYFDDDGEAVFAGTIDTLKDINVGEHIYINNAEGSSGVYFLSKSGKRLCSIVIDKNDDGWGTYFSSPSGLYVNGQKVATEKYVDSAIGSLIATT